MRSLALLTTLALLSGCVTADLRPAALQERAAPRYPECAQALLARSLRAHTGSSRPWRELRGVEVEFEDAYSGLVGALACPWPDDPCLVQLAFLPGSDTSRASFRQAGQERRWGIHAWNTWRQQGSGAPVYEAGDDAVAFWLPTLEYFLELPFRLGDAEVIDCAGKTTIDYQGRPTEVHRVYLTWGSYAPHAKLDQYLVYLDASSGLVLRADFTVRDLAPFVVASVVYEDYREVDGYWLPGQALIGGDPPRDLLHVLSVRSWRLDVELPDLVPDPSRPAAAKP